jgi:hypothetical protein
MGLACTSASSPVTRWHKERRKSVKRVKKRVTVDEGFTPRTDAELVELLLHNNAAGLVEVLGTVVQVVPPMFCFCESSRAGSNHTLSGA